MDGLTAASAEHFKVVLSGDGADELFGGYATYRASRIAAATGGWFPSAWADRIASAVNRVAPNSNARYPLAQQIGRFASGWARGRAAHVTWRRYLSDANARALYAGELVGELTRDPLERYAAPMTADPRVNDHLGQCLLADQRFYLPADMLTKVDALSMAHSLEVRLPFLDPRVLELSAQLETALLCPLSGPTKPVLRASLTRAGADSSLARRPKTGLNVPLARLLRSELASRCEQHFEAEADRTAAWLNPDALGALWREHRDGARDHGYALWALLTFTRWYASIAP
jgi:asparagine synthase (glutamine-hydrolysing)